MRLNDNEEPDNNKDNNNKTLPTVVKSKSSIDLPTDEVSDTTGDEQRQKDGKQIISEIL